MYLCRYGERYPDGCGRPRLRDLRLVLRHVPQEGIEGSRSWRDTWRREERNVWSRGRGAAAAESDSRIWS